jgi:hypothetical protein
MTLQFHHILPGIGMRRAHQKTEGLIERSPILSHYAPIECPMGFCIGQRSSRRAPEQRIGNRNRPAAAEPDDADATFSRRRCNGADRICLLHKNTSLKCRGSRKILILVTKKSYPIE